MANPNKNPNEPDDFYEAMPATYQNDFPEITDESKVTAVITLILVVLVALAMGLLFLRGLDTVKSSVPAQNDTSTAQTL